MVPNQGVTRGYNAPVRDFQAISILGCGAITLGVAWGMVARLIPSPMAHPNERSLHQNALPRAGGIAIWAGWVFIWTIASLSWLWIVPFVAIAAVSLVDDWRGLAASVRLPVH